MTAPRHRFLDPHTLALLQGVELPPRGAVEGDLAGTHRSTRHGFAVEFAGHRQYVPGDDARRIDWRVYLRTRRLYTRLYQEETNLNAYLLLDISRSMDYGSGPVASPSALGKRDFAARLAMAIAQVIVARRDAVALVPFPQAQPVVPRPASSPATLDRLAHQLDHLPEPSPDASAGDALRNLAPRLGRRRMVLLLSDLLGEPLPAIETAFRNLRQDGHDLIVFHLLHPDETQFRLRGRPFRGPHRFLPLEGGTPLRTNPSEKRLRQAYLQALGAYRDQIRSLAKTAGADYVFTTTDSHPAKTLRDFLLKRRR